MNLLQILLLLTKSAPTTEILFLVLVASTVGYLTARLFYKSALVRKTDAVESAGNFLNNRMHIHDSEIRDLNMQLSGRGKRLKHILNYGKSFMAIDKNITLGTLDTRINNTSYYQSLYEEHKALSLIVKGKPVLDYKSFGTARESEKDDLKMISGIGPIIEERLNFIDIYTFRQISRFSPRDVETINETIIRFSGRIQRDNWIEQAIELVNRKREKRWMLKSIMGLKGRNYFDRLGLASKGDADDLKLIEGIGSWVEEWLNRCGIFTFIQISRLSHNDTENITEILEIIPGGLKIDSWAAQARSLSNGTAIYSTPVSGKEMQQLVTEMQ